MIKKGNLSVAVQSLKKPGSCKDSAKKFPTGIEAMDNKLHGGFSVGLNGLTAAPGQGKSALIIQTANHLSETGITCFVFSTEATDTQMAARLVSRQTYIDNPKTAMTSEEVLEKNNSNALTHELVSEIDKVEKTSKNIFSYDCNAWDHTSEEIVDIVTAYKAEHDEDVFVFVDYLNEMRRSENQQHLDRKDFIDDVVITLKELSEKLEIPILLVCAINRDSHYSGAITLDLLKDTGRLEYNLDTIIAIDFAEMTSDREISIAILKQKNGEAGRSIHCLYHAAYNCFVGAPVEIDKTLKLKNHKIPELESDPIFDALYQL